MSSFSAEQAIRELIKTVNLLQTKVLSLEKVICEQNKLIKNLVSEKSVPLKTNSNDNEGNSSSVKPTRPIREAHIRAVSAIAAGGRKVTKKLPASSSEITTPNTPTSSMPAPTTYAPPSPSLANTDTASISDNAQCETGWTDVTYRPKRRTIENVTRGTATPTATTLMAAERKSYLHLYYVQVGTTVDQVLQYLRTICPGDNCAAEALKSRGDYASFKLSVPAKNLSKYMLPDSWAVDVCIKPWRNGFRRQADQKTQA